MNEIETYVELKYFPVQNTEEYFASLPYNCIEAMHSYTYVGPAKCTDIQRTDLLNLFNFINQVPGESTEFKVAILDILKQSLIKHYATTTTKE